MKKKEDGLEINLVQKKPHKVYKTEIEYDFQIDDLCKFLRQNKDRVVSIVVNGKHTKFNSFAGKKRFAAGFSQGSDFVLGYAKQLFEEMQEEVNTLKNKLADAESKLGKQKETNFDLVGKLRTKEVVTKLRREAYLDHVNEINEDRELLKNRLEKIEPIVRLVLEATTDGQLQRAYRLAKKLKL